MPMRHGIFLPDNALRQPTFPHGVWKSMWKMWIIGYVDKYRNSLCQLEAKIVCNAESRGDYGFHPLSLPLTKKYLRSTKSLPKKKRNPLRRRGLRFFLFLDVYQMSTKVTFCPGNLIGFQDFFFSRNFSDHVRTVILAY